MSGLRTGVVTDTERDIDMTQTDRSTDTDTDTDAGIDPTTDKDGVTDAVCQFVSATVYPCP